MNNKDTKIPPYKDQLTLPDDDEQLGGRVETSVILNKEVQSDYLNPLYKTVQITAVFVFIPTGWRTDRTVLHLKDMKDVSVETVTSSECDCNVTEYKSKDN